MFSSKVYIYTNKPRKVLFALTKLLMTDEVTRIDGSSISSAYPINLSLLNMQFSIWPQCCLIWFVKEGFCVPQRWAHAIFHST
jgi:hypothetical protein